MFLGKDFNLRFDPIIVYSVKEGGTLDDDTQIHVEFDVPSSTVVQPLKIKQIRVGKVYRYDNKTQAYMVDLSLDTRATNFANHYHDQHGTAVITYQVLPLDQTGMITGVPSTMGANIDYGYLLTSGQNEMDGPLRFSPMATVKSIDGVETINFVHSGTTHPFKGLRLDPPVTLSVNQSTNTKYVNLIPANGMTACHLLEVRLYDNVAHGNSGYDYCRVEVQAGYWRLESDASDRQDNACVAQCLRWD